MENLTNDPRPPKINIEDISNYEGNHTLLLFSRLSNPEIINQIIALQHEMEKYQIENGAEEARQDEQGRLVVDESGEYIFDKITETRPTEEIKEELEKRIALIREKTDFDYKDEMPTQEIMHLGFTFFGTQTAMTKKQLNIIAAHEKGHVVHEYHGSFFDSFFRKGFDFTNISVPEFYIKYVSESEDQDSQNELSDEALIKNIFIEKVFAPTEIAERMGQLKNYFGFKSNEEFTKEHLDYARIHYVKDTGIDNFMSVTFDAITPETESDFLRIINSAGI